eukprot:2177448-Amphidinium_carterae.1
MQVFIGVATGDETIVERVVFCDPVQLSHVTQQFMNVSWCHPSPKGVTILYQVHDRGMSRSFREATVGNFITHCGVSGEMAGLGGCALHDCHNALKWSFEAICAGSTDTLKRLHIGINCYRSAACKAMDFLAGWLMEVLCPISCSNAQPVAVLTE